MKQESNWHVRIVHNLLKLKKKSKNSSKSTIPVIEKKNNSLSPSGVVNYKKWKTEENARFYKIFKKTESKKKIRAEFKSLAKTNKKEHWEIFCLLSQLQYTYKSSLEQSKAFERQRSKKVNILEVRGAQYKYSNIIAKKIGDTTVLA